MTEDYRTSENIKQNFREYNRKIFKDEVPFCLEYKRILILQWLNIKEINNLETVWGKEKYQRFLRYIQLIGRVNAKVGTLKQILLGLQEQDPQKTRQRTQVLIQNMLKLAESVGIFDLAIEEGYQLLLNNCDLKKVPIPVGDTRYRRPSIGMTQHDQKPIQ